MKYHNPKTIYLKDYKPPKYLVDKIDLNIELYEGFSIVKSIMKFRKNPISNENSEELILNGEKLKLKSIFLDDKELNKNKYDVNNSEIIIHKVPEEFIFFTRGFLFWGDAPC